MVTRLTNRDSIDGGEGGSVKQNIKERGGSDHFTFASWPKGMFTSLYFFEM